MRFNANPLKFTPILTFPRQGGRDKNLVLIFCFLFLVGIGTLRSDDSKAVGVSATVPPVSNLVPLDAKNITTDASVGSVNWTNQILGAGWQLATEYMELDVQSNSASWRVDIYTNNTTANTGPQKGGLLSTTDNTVRLPLAWLISSEKLQEININVGEPGELITTTVDGSTGAANVSWRYLKDIGDVDDLNTTTVDESWFAAHSVGFTSVVAGKGPQATLPYGGMLADTPMYIYFEGEFSSVLGNMSYGSTSAPTIFLDFSFQ